MGTLSTGQENYTNRSSPRHAVSAPAEMMEPGSKKRMQGWTEVLSGAGCYVHAAELLAVGTVVRLRIEMNALTFDTWARVIRLARDGMGLGFFDTAESQRSVLKHWLEAEAQEAEEA